MSFEVSITIPIRAYLKRMIELTHDIEPFQLSIGKCHYSHIFYHSLEKGFKPIKADREEKFTDSILIMIPSQVVQENRFVICAKQISYIDKVLRSIFEEKIVEYLNQSCHGKGDIRKHVKIFMDLYNISEDDIRQESLVKMYYRKRKKLNMKDEINFRSKAKPTKTEDGPVCGDQVELY